MQATLEAIREKCIEEGDCWLWQGAMDKGTPRAKVGGKMVYVRRLVLELKGKKIHTGMRATTTCGDERCVNPDHVVASTPSAINAAVARRTGFARKAARRAKISAAKRKNSHVTPEMVAEIRSSDGTGRAIAARLGLHASTVNDIRAHRTWVDYSNPFFQLAA